MIRYFWAVPCSVIQWGNREGKTEPLFLAFFDIFPHCVVAFLPARRVYRLYRLLYFHKFKESSIFVGIERKSPNIYSVLYDTTGF